jgi:hypothetical protein
VPLDPEQIGPAGLTRDALGGFKAGPTEDLLKRIAWDYRQLVHERDKLNETADVLRRRVDELEALQAEAQKGLEEQRDKLNETADVLRRRVDELEALYAEAQNRLEEQRDPTDVSRSLLVAAQRMARELRDSARRDSEAALKKARARAREIEAEAQRRHDATERAERLGADIRRQLRATLDAILAAAPAEPGERPGGEARVPPERRIASR